MVDCASYLRLRPLGFEPRDDQAFGVMQQYGADCRALALLARAKPSKDASLAGLLGKRDVTRQLPAVLGPQTSPVDVERRTAATSKGIPWGELDPSLTVNEQSPIAAVLSNAGEHTKLELLAAGDFDGDHLQDVVIKTASHGDEGNWTEIRLWLLGQSPTGPLRVLERLEL